MEANPLKVVEGAMFLQVRGVVALAATKSIMDELTQAIGSVQQRLPGNLQQHNPPGLGGNVDILV